MMIQLICSETRQQKERFLLSNDGLSQDGTARSYEPCTRFRRLFFPKMVHCLVCIHTVLIRVLGSLVWGKILGYKSYFPQILHCCPHISSVAWVGQPQFDWAHNFSYTPSHPRTCLVLADTDIPLAMATVSR